MNHTEVNGQKYVHMVTITDIKDSDKLCELLTDQEVVSPSVLAGVLIFHTVIEDTDKGKSIHVYRVASELTELQQLADAILLDVSRQVTLDGVYFKNSDEYVASLFQCKSKGGSLKHTGHVMYLPAVVELRGRGDLDVKVHVAGIQLPMELDNFTFTADSTDSEMLISEVQCSYALSPVFKLHDEGIRCVTKDGTQCITEVTLTDEEIQAMASEDTFTEGGPLMMQYQHNLTEEEEIPNE